MQVLYARCCGLDVHMKTVVACVMITLANGKVEKSIRTFATTTAALLALAEWLASLQVSHVAMESTGVFWRPIYTVLEDQFELLLANAHEIKAFPGRKTDVRDCEWITDLLRHGLIRPSFIPAKPVRDLRDLMRYRESLVYQHTQQINRLHKVLETANIKLTSVVSDVWGKSGQSMLRAIIQGESDAQTLTELARGTLRGKMPQLQEALEGCIQAHHRLVLQQIFAHLQFLESSMHQLLSEIAAQMEPYHEVVEILMTHPGVQAVAAMGFVSEVGSDLSSFPDAKHFARLGWASVRAIIPVPANASMDKPPRAMSICARCWPRSSGGLVIPEITTSRRSHTASLVALAKPKPSWQCPTRLR
jgi:transposase